MEAELKQIDIDLKLYQEQAAVPGMAAVVLPMVRKLVNRKNDLTEEYATLSAQYSSPDADQLHSIQSMLKDCPGGYNPTDETVRLRLRSAIQRLVESMYVLIVPRGQDRLVVVQIWFKGRQQREFLIRVHPPTGNGKGSMPGWYRVASMRSLFGSACFSPDSMATIGPAPYDLSTPEGVAATEEMLSVDDVSLEEEFSGCERYPIP